MAQKFTRSDILEASTIIATVGAALRRSAQDTGQAGANLEFAVASLANAAEALIRSAAIGASVAQCFSLARTAGATSTGMLAVIAVAEGTVAIGMPGKVVATMSVRYGLGQIARILAATTFVSRNAVDATIFGVGAVFDRAETFAADNGDIAAYAALVSLHAAVSADLTTRSRPLPRMVKFNYPRTFSALALAHRLYGDTSRAVELVAENGVFNPAFMPRVGMALSA